jgi:hypothetical protein
MSHRGGWLVMTRTTAFLPSQQDLVGHRGIQQRRHDRGSAWPGCVGDRELDQRRSCCGKFRPQESNRPRDKGRRNTRTSKSARRATDTDRKSLLALRAVGPESEAESVRFHGRRLTKVGPEVKQGLFRGPGRAAEQWARGSLGCCPRWFGMPMTGHLRIRSKSYIKRHRRRRSADFQRPKSLFET